MKGKLDYIHRRGLPGGPNEQFTYVTGVFSVDGYRNDSPDVNNSFNVIPSGRITMKEKDGQPLKKGPILGIDNLGNQQMMMPGGEYQFPGNQVFELPLKKEGGALLDKTIKCSGCGWEWKAVDGGSDIMDCHKCGGEGLVKAQDGTEVDEEDDDREMVEGIADILRQVKSVKNRKQIADNMVEDFEEEDVDYNLQEFLKMSRVMKEGGDLRKAQMGYMMPPIGFGMMNTVSNLYDYFFGNDPKANTSSGKTPVTEKEKLEYKQLFTDYNAKKKEFDVQRRTNDNISGIDNSKNISLSSGRFQGASVSPQVVNEAVSAAKSQGVDPWLMLSVIGRESTFGSGAAGNLKRAGDKSRLVSGWDVAENYQPYEPLRYLADKKVPGIEVKKDNHGWHYDIEDRQALNNYIKQHPELVEQYREKIEATPELGKLDSFDLAAKFLKEKGLARYNPGDPDYSSMVRQDMKTLKSDPKLRSYMRTLGYEEGGELDKYQDGNETGEQENFLKNWFENRQMPTPEGQKLLEKVRPEAVQRASQNVPYVMTDQLPENVAGYYDTEDKNIYINKTYPADQINSTKQHEKVHYVQDGDKFYKVLDTPHQNLVEQNIKQPKEINTGNPEWDKNVKANYDDIVPQEEIHARIMTLRRLAGFKPDQVITEEMLNNYFNSVKQSGKTLDPDIEDLKAVTKGNSSIINLLNDMVSNPVKKQDTMYAQDGGEFSIYKDYMNGVYEGTDKEDMAKQTYDKLNRVYYKAAKDAGMSAPNYTMSTLLTL